MQTLVIRVTEGPNRGLQTIVRRGQTLQVGKSTWADLKCLEDTELEDVHFLVECTDEGWKVNLSQPDFAAHINEHPDTSPLLKHGDSITAGQSVFRVLDASQPDLPEVQQESSTPAEEPAAEDKQEEAQTSVTQLLAELNIEYDCDGEPEFADVLSTLVEQERWSDAVRLSAADRGPVDTVQWELAAFESESAGADVLPAELTELAASWVEEQTEEKRRSAEQLVETLGLESAPGWIAQTIFWSGGSLAPPDLPEAAAPSWLYTDAANSTFLLQSLNQPTADVSEYWKKLLE